MRYFEKHLYEEVGLTYEEYKMIIDILGREPNELELNLFGVMWSEHCGYKNSKALLKQLPTKGNIFYKDQEKTLALLTLVMDMQYVLRLRATIIHQLLSHTKEQPLVLGV